MNEEHRINIMQDTPAEQPASDSDTLKYASITERFVALAIDYGIIFLPFQLIAWLICKTAGRYLELWHFIAMAVGINVIFVLYEAVFSSGGRISIGKNLVGIAVVKKDLSGPISFPRALLRALGYYVSAILFFGGFVLALVDDKKQALHDYLAGSVVVQLREREDWEVWAVRAMGTLLLAVFVFGLYQSFGGREWKDKYQVRQANQFLQKLAILEEGHRIKYGYYTDDILRLVLLSGDPVQFQRDMNKVLAKGRIYSLEIGVQDGTYSFVAYANDKKHTPVYFTNRP